MCVVIGARAFTHATVRNHSNHARAQNPATKTKPVRITSAPVGRLLTSTSFMQELREHETNVEMKAQDKIDKTETTKRKKIEREKNKMENEKKKKEKEIQKAKKKAQDKEDKKKKDTEKAEKKGKKEVQARIQERMKKDKQTAKEAKAQVTKEKKDAQARRKKMKLMMDAQKKKERELKAKQAKPCCGRELESEWVGCDGFECPNGGWVHLKCAGLSEVPEGEYYCSVCD